LKSASEICLSCGQCCKDHNFALVLFPQDALALASRGWGDILAIQNNDDGDPEIQMHTRSNGDCLFLIRETNSCRIYEDRPVVCHIFPYGGEEEPAEGEESRKNWILQNCGVFASVDQKSPLRIRSLKLFAKAQELEFQLNSPVLRFVRDLIGEREEKLEALWEFRRTDSYSLTYWARENAQEEVNGIIDWLGKKACQTKKAYLGVMLTFYDHEYRAICTIQGILRGNAGTAKQFILPESHEDMLKALDNFIDPQEEHETLLLKGWEPWCI
jgi:Fe-S-cluster containining protein